MEKYFSSIHQSGISKMKKISSFNSMISLTPRTNDKDRAQTSKYVFDRSFTSKASTFKKQLNKTTIIHSSYDPEKDVSFKKSSSNIQSSQEITSFRKRQTPYFLKRKEITSFKDTSMTEKKSLRQSDSTLCQSPKSLINSGLKITDFKKIRLLGNGKYGSVYMVKHAKTGFLAALKVIRKIDIDCLEPKQKTQMINQLIRQIKIQMFLDHPNLVKLYTYFSDSYNIYLLMELGCDGQLFDLMKKKQKFNEETVSVITREVTQGLQYMHKHQVIHRDIKPQNIVLIHGFAKICDFGWSVYCSKDLRSTFCGTPLYLSPQILKGNRYNYKIDTWAIGTLAYELFSAENPFKIKKKQQLSRIITQDFTMKAGSSLQLENFITFILKKDPVRRPCSTEILIHPFISKYRGIETSKQICTLVYSGKHPSVLESFKR